MTINRSWTLPKTNTTEVITLQSHLTRIRGERRWLLLDITTNMKYFVYGVASRNYNQTTLRQHQTHLNLDRLTAWTKNTPDYIKRIKFSQRTRRRSIYAWHDSTINYSNDTLNVYYQLANVILPRMRALKRWRYSTATLSLFFGWGLI